MTNVIKTGSDIIEPYAHRLTRCRRDALNMQYDIQATTLKLIANKTLEPNETPIDWIYKPKVIEGVKHFDLYQLILSGSKEIVIGYPVNASKLEAINHNLTKLISQITRIDMRVSIRTVPFAIETKYMDPEDLTAVIPNLTWSKEMAESGIVLMVFDTGVQIAKFRMVPEVAGSIVNF